MFLVSVQAAAALQQQKPRPFGRCRSSVLPHCKRKTSTRCVLVDGAREGTRTPKDKPHAPQTCASASSATLAYLLYSSPVFEVENRWCGLLAYSNTFPAIRQVVSLFLISFFKFHIYNSSAECAQRQLSGQFHRSFVRGKPACGAAPRAKEGVRV